jgi:hypothetical protein
MHPRHDTDIDDTEVGVNFAVIIEIPSTRSC